jgi:hypothetical protein
MKIEQYNENEALAGANEDIQLDKIYRLYTSTPNGYIKIAAYTDKKMPDMKYIRKVNELIALLKEQHRKYLIDINTGGPTIDRAYQHVKFLRGYLPEAQMKRIERKVYGNLEKEKMDRPKVEQFQQRICDMYFQMYTQVQPNHYLWTRESWKEFKKKTMMRFIEEYFVSDMPELDPKFEEKEILPNEHKYQLPVAEIDFKDMGELHKLIKNLVNTNTVLPSTLGWMWKSETEYERMGLTGKHKSAIYVKHKEFGKSAKNIYWLPIAIDEQNHKLRIVPWDDVTKKFVISDDDAKNVVAIAPFSRLLMNKKSIGTADKIVSVFPNSYLYYILEKIDTALNDAMKETFVKRGLTQFLAMKKM